MTLSLIFALHTWQRSTCPDLDTWVDVYQALVELGTASAWRSMH